jgi:hypothetical protein
MTVLEAVWEVLKNGAREEVLKKFLHSSQWRGD